MADIQRWSIFQAQPAQHGGFVAYGDHLAAISELNARLDATGAALQVREMELRSTRARLEHAITLIAKIHGLLPPHDVELPDGRTMRYTPPEAVAMLHELAAKIRALPRDMREAFIDGQ